MNTYWQRNRTRLLLVAVVGLFLAVLLWGSAGAEEVGIQLPDDYVYDQIYAPTMAGLSGLVATHNGTVYVRHLGPGSEVRVSRVDVDQGSLTRILTLPPWASAGSVVGGPGDSFFVQVGAEIRQVQPDGSYKVWSSTPPNGMPEFFTKDNRMLGIGAGGKAVVEMHPDGSTTILLSGLNSVYDLIAADDGTIFISDFPDGVVKSLKPDGSWSLVTTIIKDNTDLALDQQGNLYINNAASGFARIEANGFKTPMTAPQAACRAVHSPALVTFDMNGRAIFGSWIVNELTWADFDSGDGGRLISQPWANTTAADMGPDDDLYLGVTGCGSAIPSQVVRFTVEGESEVVVDGLTGNVSALALDQAGGIYVSLATETSAGIYYIASGSSTPVQVLGTNGVDTGSLAVYPQNGHPQAGHLFALRGDIPPQQAHQITIAEYSSAGVDLHEVALPKAPKEFLLDFAPDGTLYAYASEAQRFMSGPIVERWILNLNLSNGISTIVAQVNRQGCCPLGSFGVDSSGTIWWLLSPDSLFYQISPPGGAQLFASNLPVDAAYANRTTQGDIFLNMPEGLYRIWIPTAGERVQLVIDIVDQFVYYAVLGEGQGQALTAKLQAIAMALERGQTAVAYHQTSAFLTQLRVFTQTGILDETLADLLILAVDKYILAYS